MLSHLFFGFILLILFFSQQVSAQSTAVPFLLVQPSARVTAMGESGAALTDDDASAFINPACLGFQKGQEVNLSYTGWIPQYQQFSDYRRQLVYDNLYYGYGNYQKNITEINSTISASITYLYLGPWTIVSSDNSGPYGSFVSKEFIVSIKYGTNLISNWGIGIGFNYVHDKIMSIELNEEGEYTVSSLSADIGILYRPSRVIIPFTQIDLGNRFGVGLAITNIGPSVSYIDEEQADPLPTNLRLGIAIDFINNELHKVTWTCDANKLIISRTKYKADPFFTAITKTWTTFSYGRKKNISDIMREINFGTGVEYCFSNMIYLRGGYFYEDPAMGNRRMFTFGAGVRYDMFGLDLSYIALYGKYTARTPAIETLRLTASVNWDKDTSK